MCGLSGRLSSYVKGDARLYSIDLTNAEIAASLPALVGNA